MQRISRLITNTSGVPLSGLRARITRIGGNSPCPYSLSDGGNLFRDGNAVTASTGKVIVWIPNNYSGCRITVFNVDHSIAFQEDVFPAFEASGIAGSDSDSGSAAVAVPVRIALGFNTVTLAASATRVVDLIVVYSDGSIVRNPGSGVTAVSATPAKATVVAGTRTITAVATGSSVVTFTYTSGAIVLTDDVTVTVS